MVPTARRAHWRPLATLFLVLLGLAALGGCPIFWGGHEHEGERREGEHREGEHREGEHHEGHEGERR